MKKIFLISSVTAVILGLFTACSEDRLLPEAKPTNGNQGGEEPVLSLEPAACNNKIVAHRGGSSECGSPDNSIASLKYAMSLKLYASECDIYWTKDNNVVVAHADGDCKINGLFPWQATLAEIRAAGRLKNGESVPCLEDFLSTVMVEGNCTKLWLDIKNITDHADYASKSVERACEIIKAAHAEKFCEFICTGNTTVATAAVNCQVIYGIPVGWMASSAPSTHISKGFRWTNLSTEYMCAAGGGTGTYTVDQFVNAGLEFSVFNVDKSFSNEVVNWYVSNYPKMKAICTNYPKWLLEKVQ